MNTPRKSIHDADALLLYQVGPVCCCSPTMPVKAVIMPPQLTQLPGATSSIPGIFKYSSGIVHVVDLRNRFGVEDEDKKVPGRIVVVEIEQGLAGIWVDEIIDVIQFPGKGWGQVPSYIPRNIFTRTLLFDKKILLYADFENLHKFNETGYLRQHIEMLKKDAVKQQVVLDSDTGNALLLNPPDDVNPVTEQHDESSEVKNHQQKIGSQPKEITEVSVQEPLLSVSHYKHEKPVTRESEVSDSISRKVITESGIRKSTAYKKPEQQVGLNKGSMKEGALGRRTPGIVSREIPEKQSVSMASAEDDFHIHSDNQEISQYSGKSRNAEMEVAAENNVVFWSFGFVLVLLVVFLYYSSEKLFPENIKIHSDAVVTVQERPNNDTSDIFEHSKVSIDKPEDIRNIGEIIENQGDVVELRSVASHRAEITHDKDEIVIVLQQPEEDMDVFNAVQNDDRETRVMSQEERVLMVEDEVIKHEELNPDRKSISTSEDIVGIDVMNSMDDSSENKKFTIDTGSSVEIEVAPKKEQVTKPLITRIVHVVVKGDTLWHIAERYIKDPFKYPELARLSKIKNPDLIYPGNKVIIIMENKKFPAN